MKSIITLVLICLANIAWASTITGRVVGIADGDTITVLDASNTQYKIRLSGIDAPEKKQGFGTASKHSLSDLVFDKQVTIEWDKEDRYGRIIGKVILSGVDINLQQIKTGMAWFYRKYQNELTLDDRLNFLHAEEDAKKNGSGLWTQPNPTAPWEFRKARR